MSGSSFDPYVDYYNVLGVDPSATPLQIRAAYRRLAKASHPDLHAGSSRAAALMARLNRAKSVLLDTEARAAYDAMRRARWDDVGQVDRRHSAWRSQAGPVRRAPSRVSEAPRPTEGRRSDRQTVFLLVLVVPLLGALLFYVVDAVQVAGRASRASASDLALAPLSRASAEGAARSAFVLVAGQKPNPQAAASANRAIRSYVDGPPEGEILRSIGRRLVQAAASDDVQAWSQAVSELCVMAGTCQSPAHGH